MLIALPYLQRIDKHDPDVIAASLESENMPCLLPPSYGVTARRGAETLASWESEKNRVRRAPHADLRAWAQIVQSKGKAGIGARRPLISNLALDTWGSHFAHFRTLDQIRFFHTLTSPTRQRVACERRAGADCAGQAFSPDLLGSYFGLWCQGRKRALWPCTRCTRCS